MDGAVLPQKFGAFEAYAAELGTIAVLATGAVDRDCVWNMFVENKDPVEVIQEGVGLTYGTAGTVAIGFEATQAEGTGT